MTAQQADIYLKSKNEALAASLFYDLSINSLSRFYK